MDILSIVILTVIVSLVLTLVWLIIDDNAFLSFIKLREDLRLLFNNKL